MPFVTLKEIQNDAENGGLVEKSMVVEQFRRTSDVLDAMRFDPMTGSAYQYQLETGLPTAAFRGINEDFTANHGTVSPQVEATKIVGGQVKVDRANLKMHGEGAFARQLRMKSKAVARTITDNFIQGDSASDGRQFDGLAARIPIGSDQAISNGSTSGGDALSLANLDYAINETEEPTHIWINRRLRNRFIAAARDTTITGFVQHGLDELGRPVMTYNDLPMLFGYPKSTSDSFLPFTEAATGGGTTATSIYVVSIREDGLHMLQVGDLDVEEPQKVSEGVGITTDIEWLLLMAIESQYAVTRLHSIKDAAIVK
jgi:hypothetical protein